MLSNTKPTAAELRVMRAEAAQVRAEHEQAERDKIVVLPRPRRITAVAS
jgi:hypothetical protein